MNGLKKWFRTHAVTLVCGVLIIILLWVFFMFVFGVAEKNTRIDAFEAFCRKAEECELDIAVLSEYELGQRDPEDNEYHEISPTGYPQETRDRVFAVVGYGGCTSHSANYHHYGDIGEYAIVYDTEGTEPYTAGSEYYYLIGDKIIITMLED